MFFSIIVLWTVKIYRIYSSKMNYEFSLVNCRSNFGSILYLLNFTFLLSISMCDSFNQMASMNPYVWIIYLPLWKCLERIKGVIFWGKVCHGDEFWGFKSLLQWPVFFMSLTSDSMLEISSVAATMLLLTTNIYKQLKS